MVRLAKPAVLDLARELLARQDPRAEVDRVEANLKLDRRRRRVVNRREANLDRLEANLDRATANSCESDLPGG